MISEEDMKPFIKIPQNRISDYLIHFDDFKYGRSMIETIPNNGVAYTDNLEEPTVIIFSIFVMHYLTGDASSEYATKLVGKIPPKNIILVPNKDWHALLDNSWETVHTLSRIEFRYTEDYNSLNNILSSSQENYRIRDLDSHDVQSNRQVNEIANTLFRGEEHFLQKGIGFGLIDQNNNICSFACSVMEIGNYLDIQIETMEDYRRKGYATITGARITKYALDNDVIPVWISMNDASASLAKKIGYSEYGKFEMYYFE